MVLDFWLAVIHHAVLLLMVAVLGAEAALLRLPPSLAVIARLGRLDLIYGISAGMLLFAGISRLAWGAKGWAFYSGNSFFWVKMALFALIGVLSIQPTLCFIRWRRQLKLDANWLPDIQSWERCRKAAFLQMHLLPLVALAAAAMARGFGV